GGRRDTKESSIDFVHGSKLSHVLQEHGCTHHFFQTTSGCRQNRRKILENSFSLRRHVTADNLLGRRINGYLPGDEDESVRSDSLGIRANRLWAIVGRNNVAHELSKLYRR